MSNAGCLKRTKTPAPCWGLGLASASCLRAAMASSIGALPPRSRAVGERTKDAPFEWIGAHDLAGAALNRQFEQPSTGTSGAHNGNVTAQRAVVEIMPSVPRQAVANDVARHALPTVAGTRVVIRIAGRPPIRGWLFIVAIDPVARKRGPA